MEQSSTLKSKNKKLQGFLLLLLGLATAIIAQATLVASRQETDWDTYFTVGTWLGNIWNNTSPVAGLVLYLLAGIFFIFGLHELRDHLPGLLLRTSAPLKHRPKFGFWITSFGLSVAIAFYAARADSNDPYGYFFSALWIVSIVLFVVSVLVDTDWQPPSTGAILAWLKNHYAELIAITATLIAAFVIRILDIEAHPYSFINDEAQMGSGGACILQGICTHFFSLGWAEQSRLAYLPYAVNIGLFGRTALAIRLVSVVTGTLSVLATYLFAREAFNQKIAWISAVLLTSLPIHIHFSRTGVDNIVDSLTAPLVLWLLVRGAKRNSTLSFLAAGIAAGLCIYTYPGSLLTPVIGVSALVYFAIQTRGFLQAQWMNIGAFVLAAVITIIPLLGFYSANSQLFLARFQSEGILHEGRLESQAESYGVTPAEILASQFAKSSLVFIATEAPINFFNSPRPYLPGAVAVVFMLGLAYMFWRIKDLRCMVILVWFWAVVVLGSTLTGGAPTSQRILSSIPALAIITAVGITKILATFQQLYQPMGRLVPIVLLGFMLYIGYTNFDFYFYEYRVEHFYEDPTNELSYETRTYISPLHPDGEAYIIGNPDHPFLTFESFHFFSPEVKKSTINGITYETLLLLPKDKDFLFIAVPDYVHELEVVRQYIPGGEWTAFKRRYQPEHVLFYSYKITKEQLAALTP